MGWTRCCAMTHAENSQLIWSLQRCPRWIPENLMWCCRLCVTLHVVYEGEAIFYGSTKTLNALCVFFCFLFVFSVCLFVCFASSLWRDARLTPGIYRSLKKDHSPKMELAHCMHNFRYSSISVVALWGNRATITVSVCVKRFSNMCSHYYF